ADRLRLAQHVRPDQTEYGLRAGARGHARRGLTRARTLDDIADIFVPEFQRSREVGVTGAKSRHRIGRLGHRLDAHDALPVRRVAVVDLQGDRRAGRATLADTAGDAHRVALDLLPSPAPVSELPAPEVCVDLSGRHRESRRHAVDDREDARPVRLAGGEEPHTGRGSAARIASSGAGTPVQSSNERAAWWRSMLSPSTTVTFSVAFARLTSGVSSAVGTRSMTQIGSCTSSRASSPFSPSGVAFTTASTSTRPRGHGTTMGCRPS